MIEQASTTDLPDVHVNDLVKQWGCHRNTVKNRAKLLGIELIEVGYHDRYWPGEWVAAGHELNEWVKQGNTPASFLANARQGSDSSQPVEQSDKGGAIQQSNNSQPVRQSDTQQIRTGVVGFDAAAFMAAEQGIDMMIKSGRYMETFALAGLFGVDPVEVESWESGHKPRKGIEVRKGWIGSKENKRVQWKLVEPKAEERAAELAVTSIAPAQKRGPGFNVANLIVDVSHSDVTGSDLFDNNRIVGFVR